MGYYGTEQWNIFRSESTQNQWIVYNFNAVVRISKVILKARYRPIYTTKLDGMYVRVGTSYGNNGDFSSFSDFGEVPLSATPQGVIVVIDRSNAPVWGQFLALERFPGKTGLVIADIKVIG